MKKRLYKKVVSWEKKPDKDLLIWGSILLIASLLMLSFSLSENSLVILGIVFTAMFIYGFNVFRRGLGKGREILYEKRK